MNRLKAIMLCTFSLARGRIIGLATLQLAITAFFLIFTQTIEQYNIIFCGDIFTVAYMFIFGIIFSNRHSAFCISNSVSLKYRVYSLGAAIISVSILAAVLNTVSHAFFSVKYSFSLAEAFRYIVIGGAIPNNFPLATLTENIFCYIMITMLGCLLGTLRSLKGDGFTLLMLLIVAVVTFVLAYLGKYYTNPLIWLFVLPAIMLRNRFTAIILSILLTAVFGYFSYLLFYGSAQNTRRDKREKV